MQWFPGFLPHIPLSRPPAWLGQIVEIVPLMPAIANDALGNLAGRSLPVRPLPVCDLKVLFFVICFNYRMRRAKASLAYPLPVVCAPFTPTLSARPPQTYPTRGCPVTFLFSPICVSSRLFLTFPLFFQYEAPPKLLLLPPCPPLSLRM